MTTDPRDDYKAAMQQYANACGAASSAIKLIKDVSNGFEYNFPTFLTATFSLVSPGSDRYKVEKFRFDMRHWPDIDQMTKLLTAWHHAFTNAHAAWNRMSDADRAVGKAPPDQMKPS